MTVIVPPGPQDSGLRDHGVRRPLELQQAAKALGDPTRHRIFRYVAEAVAPVGVAELTGFMSLNHNAVRQHLSVLRAAGLVVEGLEDRQRPADLALCINCTRRRPGPGVFRVHTSTWRDCWLKRCQTGGVPE